MISNTILHKYLRHLRQMDRDAVVHIDAVELALRLALEELAESIPSTADTTADENLIAAQGRRIMELQADLERLQTATNVEVAEMRQQIAQMDADNAALIRHNRELTDALHISKNGTGLAIQNPPFVDSAPSAITPATNSMWHGPDMLTLLDDEAADWWIGCDTGRHQWRTVPKPVQLRMIRHILSYGPEGGAMTMREFDAIKPEWMPSATSHTQTLRLSWQQLNDCTVELEATR